MSVSVISFGFKYGIPIEADLVFDVRFLPNPYYIAELRHQTGLDEGVYSFVFGYQQTKDFMAHLESLIGFLLPQYVEEGKAALASAAPAGSTARWPLPRPWPTSSSRRAIRPRRTTGT